MHASILQGPGTHSGKYTQSVLQHADLRGDEGRPAGRADLRSACGPEEILSVLELVTHDILITGREGLPGSCLPAPRPCVSLSEPLMLLECHWAAPISGRHNPGSVMLDNNMHFLLATQTRVTGLAALRLQISAAPSASSSQGATLPTLDRWLTSRGGHTGLCPLDESKASSRLPRLAADGSFAHPETH